MAEIYQKPSADKCLILEPGEALLREMALPTQWTQIMLAFALSWTTSADDNTNPTNESVTYLNPLSSFAAGIKDGSMIAPGRAGSRFVGFRTNHVVPTTLTSGELSPSQYKVTWVTDGVTSNSGGTAQPVLSFPANSSAATLFGSILLLRLTVSGTSVTAALNVTAAATDFGDAALKSAMLNASLINSASVPGWWLNGETPEVRHIYLRSPFQNNRLRVHNYGYMVIS